MPYRHSPEQIKADGAAVAAGICPETGKKLADLNVRVHVAHLWPHLDRLKQDTDAARRARLLLNWANEHQKE